MKLDVTVRKTLVWLVENKDRGHVLGIIEWYGPWRCYAFTPSPDCVFEKTCLREIADFCDEQDEAQAEAERRNKERER